MPAAHLLSCMRPWSASTLLTGLASARFTPDCAAEGCCDRALAMALPHLSRRLLSRRHANSQSSMLYSPAIRSLVLAHLQGSCMATRLGLLGPGNATHPRALPGASHQHPSLGLKAWVCCSRCCVFIMDTRSCGLGTSLPSIDLVIIHDSEWNQRGDLQAIGRARCVGRAGPDQPGPPGQPEILRLLVRVRKRRPGRAWLHVG